ncbi:MAG: hypothetical protein Q4A67_00190 [Aerococcus sp.]|nr:hypothetical protein [Aerococcus sp.]
MNKQLKLFLGLLIIYIIAAYLVKDNQTALILVTVFFAIINSALVTLNLTKKNK